MTVIYCVLWIVNVCLELVRMCMWGKLVTNGWFQSSSMFGRPSLPNLDGKKTPLIIYSVWLMQNMEHDNLLVFFFFIFFLLRSVVLALVLCIRSNLLLQ